MRSLTFCLLVGCLVRLNVAAAASIPTPNSGDHGDSFGYESRIASGQATSISSFPYQVSVQIVDEHFCGGSILKPNVVITVAHCIIWHQPASSYKVRVGSTQHDDGGQLVDVRRIIVHEKYSKYTDSYDVALLQLAVELQYTDSVQPVQLPEADVLLPAMTPLNVSGWGNTRVEVSEEFPSALRYAEEFALDQQWCERFYNDGRWHITSTMLCSGSNSNRMSVCWGDSGSPLVSIGADKQRTLQGIALWSWHCGIKGYPSVYTNVAVVRRWIDAKLVEMGASA